MKKYDVAIVGVTGLVGQTFLKVLQEYNFPISKLVLYASKKSAGKMIEYDGNFYNVRELNVDNIEKVDFVFMSAGEKVSLKYAPLFEEQGAIVIDNSSAWRMNDDCALIVPEVNMDSLIGKRNIIANPNCSTIQCMLPLYALSKKYEIIEVRYVTYQAVSGSGIKGINDLKNGLNKKSMEFYPCNISENCLPQIGEISNNNYTKEEMKMVNETKKILNNKEIKISATCVRVPIEKCHSILVQVKINKDFNIEDIYRIFIGGEGIILNDIPLAENARNTDKVIVGRIRKDLIDNKSLYFYCVADNIRKGAASNAVQIALKILRNIN